MSADPDPVKCENSLREILTLMIDRVAADMSTVGAFALPAGSADCAITVVLPAGAYTANVGSVRGGIGNVLVEIYQLP